MKSMSSSSDDVPYRILIVEDDQNDVIFYTELLGKNEDVSFCILESADVNEALRICRRDSIDCILLDYRLLDADGIDFIKLLKQESRSSNTAIIIVANQSSEQAAAEIMKLGITDYIARNIIVKEFFVQNILNAIERIHFKNQARKSQQECEKSYKALCEFTHAASHDLKAPLRRINGYCKLLKEKTGSTLGPEERGYIDRLMIITKSMQTIIDDLLTYSLTLSVEENKINLDLKKIVTMVVEDIDTLIKENNAIVLIRDLPTIPVYQNPIKDLFQKLIDNALKYKGKNDPIITISCEDNGTFFLFSVNDNGEGIDEKYHELIFKDFERLHTQDEVEGSGLGLAICSKVIELHSGKMWVESKPGEGSTFKFSIPKA